MVHFPWIDCKCNDWRLNFIVQSIRISIYGKAKTMNTNRFLLIQVIFNVAKTHYLLILHVKRDLFLSNIFQYIIHNTCSSSIEAMKGICMWFKFQIDSKHECECVNNISKYSKCLHCLPDRTQIHIMFFFLFFQAKIISR